MSGCLLLAVAPPLRADDGSAPQAAETPPHRPDWGLGPLDFRDDNVLHLTHLMLAADTPATLNLGEIQLAVRGDLAKTIASHEEIDAVIDAETVVGAPIIRFGLAPRLQLGIEVPAVYRYHGITDPMARAVEQLFHSIRTERLKLPDNFYRVSGGTDDGGHFNLREGVGLGKLQVGLKIRVFGEDPPWPAVSIEGVGAFPTGTPNFGTHGVDLGVRLAVAERLGDFVLYGGGATIFPGGNIADVSLMSVNAMAFVAVEFEVEPWLAAIYQGWYESPVVRNLSHRDGVIVYHGGGLKASNGRYFGEVGFLHNGGDFVRSANYAFHVEVGITF